MELAMKSYNSNDTEYLGYYVTKTTHYDRWNEYIRKTCTREVRVGTDSNGNPIYETEEYDCSYVKDHPEKWSYTTNDGKETECSEKKFDKIRKKFKSPTIFRDMRRNYHTIDGDAQDYFWQNDLDNVESITKEHWYENRIKSGKSILAFKKLKKKDIKTWGLYDYPEVEDGYQTSVVGINLPESQTKYIDALNALYGKDHQIRMFMLFFPDKPALVSEYQKSYWEGGNKNEIVICLGYDSKTNKITWCEAWSWSDVPLIEGRAKQYFMNHNDINLKDFYHYIIPFVTTDWNRKSFSDFNYINIELSLNQMIWVFVITLLYDLGISIWIVVNQYKVEED